MIDTLESLRREVEELAFKLGQEVAHNERYRNALREIEDGGCYPDARGGCDNKCCEIARDALARSGDGGK